MKKTLTLLICLITISFYNCKKENRIAKKISDSTWIINEYKRAVKYGDTTKTDFSDFKMTFNFFKFNHKKAYSSLQYGSFIIDYADTLKKDWVDTFQYQLKGSDIEILRIVKYLDHSNGEIVNGIVPKQNKLTLGLWRQRFKIEGYKTNILKLIRKDSTDLYIKAIKQ